MNFRLSRHASAARALIWRRAYAGSEPPRGSSRPADPRPTILPNGARPPSWSGGLLRLLLVGAPSLKLLLIKLRLVSVAEIENIDDEEIRYALYLHRGPGEHFPIIRESLPFRLQKHWCYLLAADKARDRPAIPSRSHLWCSRGPVRPVGASRWPSPKIRPSDPRALWSTHEE
jgi:hypothetical protein